MAAGDSDAELVPAIKVALAALPAANLATLRLIIETCYRECLLLEHSKADFHAVPPSCFLHFQRLAILMLSAVP